MKRISVYVFAIVIAGAASAIFATVAHHRSHVVLSDVSKQDASKQTDAAFRDGLFLARLDAEHGRKPHLASGRWSTEADRHSFVSAYLQAYREMQGSAAAEQLGSSQPAAQRGYRDGLADGRQQRYESMSFQPAATENYQRADRGYSDGSGGLNQYKKAYREAYCNGYQLAYYGETTQIETANLRGANAPE
jgi:hypothetical protein